MTGKARYRRKRLCPGRAEGRLDDAIQQERRFEKRNEGIQRAGDQKDLRSVQLLPVLMGAVVAGRAVLVIRAVRRSVLVTAFTVPAVIMSGGFDQAFMMHHAVTQLADHRLR